LNIIEPGWAAPAWVRAWVTTRSGGCSEGPYRSLNLGDHVGDDPQRVSRNRQRLGQALDLPGPARWLTQVHGDRVLSLPREAIQPADAAVTSEPGVVCAVLTADCLPVLLSRRDGSAAGVAHAGWRGLAAGVLENAVAALGGAAGDVVAWLGPAISQPAYEVGDEVRDALLARYAAAHVAFERNAAGRWQADLAGVARLALTASGVSQIDGGDLCSFSDARFFSHRREAPCGRMATLIWLEPTA
jgi:YfiH family protein